METKSPKKIEKKHLGDMGVSESDFHLARSRDLGQRNASHLERMALIGNKDDTHPRLLGATYAPTLQELKKEETKLMKKREELDRKAINNDPRIIALANLAQLDEWDFGAGPYYLQIKRWDRERDILYERGKLLDHISLPAFLQSHVPLSCHGNSIITNEDIKLAKKMKILKDKINLKQRQQREDTVTLPFNEGITSFLDQGDLKNLNETSQIMKKKTKKRLNTLKHSSKKKDFKKLMDRLTGGRKTQKKRRNNKSHRIKKNVKKHKTHRKRKTRRRN